MQAAGYGYAYPALRYGIAHLSVTMTIVLETDRLTLRRPTTDDASFFLTLVNQDSWLHYIGDHEVYDIPAAIDYILDGPIAMLEEFGYALCVMELKPGGPPIGLCGVVKRDGLALPDLGFALIDAYAGKGYASEAARACMTLARDTLKIPTLLAMALPSNQRSIRLLTRLGFRDLGTFRLNSNNPVTKLFECTLQQQAGQA